MHASAGVDAARTKGSLVHLTLSNATDPKLHHKTSRAGGGAMEAKKIEWNTLEPKTNALISRVTAKKAGTNHYNHVIRSNYKGSQGSSSSNTC